MEDKFNSDLEHAKDNLRFYLRETSRYIKYVYLKDIISDSFFGTGEVVPRRLRVYL